MGCDEILRLIRAVKTYNLKYVKVEGLTLVAKGENPVTAIKLAEDPKAEEELEDAIAEEMDEYQQEQLLITDPVEYERQNMGG